MENLIKNPGLRYGVIALFIVIACVSFYISVFQYKIIDDQGVTTYNIGRSFGFFISFLIALYIIISLVLGKTIDVKLLKELSDNLSSIGKGDTTFKMK